MTKTLLVFAIGMIVAWNWVDQPVWVAQSLQITIDFLTNITNDTTISICVIRNRCYPCNNI